MLRTHKLNLQSEIDFPVLGQVKAAVADQKPHEVKTGKEAQKILSGNEPLDETQDNASEASFPQKKKGITASPPSHSYRTRAKLPNLILPKEPLEKMAPMGTYEVYGVQTFNRIQFPYYLDIAGMKVKVLKHALAGLMGMRFDFKQWGARFSHLVSPRTVKTALDNIFGNDKMYRLYLDRAHELFLHNISAKGSDFTRSVFNAKNDENTILNALAGEDSRLVVNFERNPNTICRFIIDFQYYGQNPKKRNEIVLVPVLVSAFYLDDTNSPEALNNRDDHEKKCRGFGKRD